MLSTTMFIMMYFDRLRGTAYGISTTGLTISGFVFPRFMLFLIETVGFKGSLLLLGAIVMHLTPLSRLLKVPPWSKSERKRSDERNAPPLSISAQIEEQQGAGNGSEHVDTTGVANTIWTNDLRTLAHSFRFYVIVPSTTITTVADVIFASTMIDFAMDKNVDITSAVWLTSGFTATEVIGNVFLPLLADKGFLRRSTLLMVTQLLMGCALILTPHATSFWMIAVAVGMVSALVECALLMHDVLAVDYFGVARLPTVRGIMGVLKAPLMLCSPALIGEYL